MIEAERKRSASRLGIFMVAVGAHELKTVGLLY
jgi:hypothetical protein